MKKKLVRLLSDSPTTIGIAVCFIATWVALERMENKINEILKRVK